MEKSKKILKIVVVLLISLVVYRILEHDQYVKLLDAIKEHDNQKVERILRWNYFDLDKQSGHFPWAWLPESDDCYSPLETACKYGNYKAAKMLIKKGADAGRVQEEHFSLLYLSMESTESDDFNLIKLLVQNGADPNGAPDDDHDGSSSLENCARMDCGDYYYNNYLSTTGSWEEELKKRYEANYDEKKAVMITNIYHYLDERIQNYNNPEEQITGATPMHWAANFQNMALIQYLIDQGRYRVNDKDHDGQTCLHYLVRFEKPNEYNKKWKEDTLVLLINNGADPTIKDKEGKTPYDYAVENKDDYLAGLLKPYMKNSDKDSGATD